MALFGAELSFVAAEDDAARQIPLKYVKDRRSVEFHWREISEAAGGSSTGHASLN
jgi:hypothetical protein